MRAGRRQGKTGWEEKGKRVGREEEEKEEEGKKIKQGCAGGPQML